MCSSDLLFIIPLGSEGSLHSVALNLATQLRNDGKVVEIAFGERALKGAMKAADKSGAKYLIVLGESEVSSGEVEIKTMSSGATKKVRISDLVKEI